MMVFDVQVHVWQRNTPERPWIAGYPDPFTIRTEEFLGDRLTAEMDRAGVDKALLVPTNFAGAYIDVSLDEAAKHPGRFHVAPRVEPDREERGNVLSYYREDPRVVACRVVFHSPEQQAALEEGRFEWVWPAAERDGIPLFVYPPDRLDVVRRVAESHPRLKLAINHIGVPTGLQDDQIVPYVDELVGLARCDNVAVAASCLPKFSTQSYPYPNLHRHVERIVRAFGAERVFWGSDITACPADYPHVVSLFTEELSFLSKAELEMIMGQALFRWLGEGRLR